MIPRISIVMPTYNRRDTIERSIASVRAQTWGDWELIVVDDGSTDGTADVIAGIDPRVRVITQENQGVAGARNTGLAAARGALISFLDSDDVWPVHHLAFAAAFFDAHPREQAMTCEFWEDFGNGDYVKHFRIEASEWYPATARRIGSTAFDLPAPKDDPYLRFYATRNELGAWAQRPLEKTPYGGAHHYWGQVFSGWRWGWLMALQPTVFRRSVMVEIGSNDTSYRVASDFGYLAELCRCVPMNFFSLPGCIKHELSGAGRPPSEGHLVTGKTAIRFHQDVLRFHEELFWKAKPNDPELTALRGFRQSLVGAAALIQGERALALENLEQAARTYPGADTAAMLWLARLPQDRVASLAYRGWLAGSSLASRVRRRVSRTVSA